MAIRVGIDIGSDTIKTVVINGKGTDGIEKIEPVRITGKPAARLKEILANLSEKYGNGNGEVILAVTGSGASKISHIIGVEHTTEIDALSASLKVMDPDTAHVVEIGAETQKYLSYFCDQESGQKLLEDVIPGIKCAGGTGSFLDYMHRRLRYDSLEDFIEKGNQVTDPAPISGRCAVFAESDIVHHYQKGTSRDRIVAGIHQAVARSYKNLVQKTGLPKDKVAFVGGVALNDCMKKHLAKELELEEEQIYTPEHAVHIGAIGAALRAETRVSLSHVVERLEESLKEDFDYDCAEQIKLEKSILMHQSTGDGITDIHVATASLGIDIGSVSTKAAMITKIDGEFKVLASFYRRTEGNPIEAVKDTLDKIRTQLKEKNITIDKIIASTTGSGRYLTGYFVGASEIRDEITAQAFGVSAFIKEHDLTVIEIGGQDSKFLKLRDGVISDFEMNWACAAGTGALIEKHAKNLGIDITEFGDYALGGDKPPIINSTCAVFSEAALMFFQQNNLSVENLCAGACLASARNYIIKVVRNRSMGEKIAFQGAVAFNKGMVGAFETVLGKPIIVPPYPHLTGAVGVARSAYERDERKPEPTKFRGFEEIISTQYQLSSFVCKQCGNECSVNQFKVEGENFYQGDRCDRFSGIHKKSLGEHLPDLFAEREDMLLNSYKNQAPETAKTVGIPRGLMFNEYFPLFSAVFGELGFKVTTTEASNKRIIRKGIQTTIAEPCFPIKVAHGHALEIVEQGADYIFMPSVITTDGPMGNYEMCVTCPYVQSSPDVIKSALGLDDSGKTKLLKPVFYFDRGINHIERKFVEILEPLGKSAKDIKKAVKKGMETLAAFRDKLRKRGQEILDNMKEGETAFVIIARPYALHDPGINMNAGKKVKDEGYLAIPFDFLPLNDEKYDVSGSWPNIYSIQGQKKLMAARFIKQHKNLHALVITYFGCGPDAFLDQMFHEELGDHYLTMQIDEHTSDTGIITRIQAYLASVDSETEEKVDRKIDTSAILFENLKGKKLWLPYMNEGARLLAGTMRAHGVDADVLPRSGDPALTLARNFIAGDVCMPMLYTTQDMLHRAKQPDFDPSKEAFFQGKSGGPCRYGMYYMIEKLLLDHHIGIEQGKVDLVTVGNRNPDGGLGTSFLIMVWDTLLTHDLLEKMLLHTRPYEVNKGESDKIFLKYVNRIMDEMQKPENKVDNAWKMTQTATGGNLEWLKKILKDAMAEFEKVEKRSESRPLVGIVGEFYVRLHEPANAFIIRTLEEMGCEVWMAPQTEFFGYSNYITGVHSEDKWKDDHNLKWWQEAQTKKFLNKLALNHEHVLFDVIKPYVGKFDELSPEEVVKLGSAYITPFFGGEAILSMGKSEDYARRNLDGIVSISPFNCMPSLVVSALSKDLRKKFNKIPYLNIDFDGFQDNAREQRISAFVSQVKERHKVKEEKSVSRV
ncbi:MAG: acyl-CoA dehydratase activase [Firmicutes bacterium]|nr:acyl-CoA dehydratase activase [Bacillota bacterium]